VSEYLDIQEVAGKLGVSPATIRRWWYSGSIIPPVRLSKRCLRWHAKKLELWERSRVPAARPEEKPNVPALPA
jgi:predicted DNA-binding transcriptional regulator AlpA